MAWNKLKVKPLTRMLGGRVERIEVYKRLVETNEGEKAGVVDFVDEDNDRYELEVDPQTMRSITLQVGKGRTRGYAYSPEMRAQASRAHKDVSRKMAKKRAGKGTPLVQKLRTEGRLVQPRPNLPVYMPKVGPPPKMPDISPDTPREGGSKESKALRRYEKEFVKWEREDEAAREKHQREFYDTFVWDASRGEYVRRAGRGATIWSSSRWRRFLGAESYEKSEQKAEGPSSEEVRGRVAGTYMGYEEAPADYIPPDVAKGIVDEAMEARYYGMEDPSSMGRRQTDQFVVADRVDDYLGESATDNQKRAITQKLISLLGKNKKDAHAEIDKTWEKKSVPIRVRALHKQGTGGMTKQPDTKDRGGRELRESTGVAYEPFPEYAADVSRKSGETDIQYQRRVFKARRDAELAELDEDIGKAGRITIIDPTDVQRMARGTKGRTREALVGGKREVVDDPNVLFHRRQQEKRRRNFEKKDIEYEQMLLRFGSTPSEAKESVRKRRIARAKREKSQRAKEVRMVRTLKRDKEDGVEATTAKPLGEAADSPGDTPWDKAVQDYKLHDGTYLRMTRAEREEFGRPVIMEVLPDKYEWSLMDDKELRYYQKIMGLVGKKEVKPSVKLGRGVGRVGTEDIRFTGRGIPIEKTEWGEPQRMPPEGARMVRILMEDDSGGVMVSGVKPRSKIAKKDMGAMHDHLLPDGTYLRMTSKQAGKLGEPIEVKTPLGKPDWKLKKLGKKPEVRVSKSREHGIDVEQVHLGVREWKDEELSEAARKLSVQKVGIVGKSASKHASQMVRSTRPDDEGRAITFSDHDKQLIARASQESFFLGSLNSDTLKALERMANSDKTRGQTFNLKAIQETRTGSKGGMRLSENELRMFKAISGDDTNNASLRAYSVVKEIALWKVVADNAENSGYDKRDRKEDYAAFVQMKGKVNKRDINKTFEDENMLAKVEHASYVEAEKNHRTLTNILEDSKLMSDSERVAAASKMLAQQKALEKKLKLARDRGISKGRELEQEERYEKALAKAYTEEGKTQMGVAGIRESMRTGNLADMLRGMAWARGRSYTGQPYVRGRIDKAVVSEKVPKKGGPTRTRIEKLEYTVLPPLNEVIAHRMKRASDTLARSVGYERLTIVSILIVGFILLASLPSIIGNTPAFGVVIMLVGGFMMAVSDRVGLSLGILMFGLIIAMWGSGIAMGIIDVLPMEDGSRLYMMSIFGGG